MVEKIISSGMTPAGESPEGLSDESLLSRYVFDGNKEAFNLLHQRYRDRVINLLWRYCGDFHRAEDIAQDTFITIYNQASQFRFQGKVSAWIFKIAVNKAHTAARRAREKRFLSLEEITSPEDQTEAVAEITPPDLALERAEYSKKIQECLNLMPLKYRRVLVLSYVENIPQREIAEILGCRPGTVASLVSRGRRIFCRLFRRGSDEEKRKNIRRLLVFILWEGALCLRSALSGGKPW